jgi:hypothetical protein
MKTFNHSTKRRERSAAPQQPTSRSERRAEQRKAERAERKARVKAKLKANPRLVRA